MLRLSSLDKLMDKGWLDDVYKDVRRYGRIVQDSTQEDEQGVEARFINIEHKGRLWSFVITLGHVNEAGWKLIK